MIKLYLKERWWDWRNRKRQRRVAPHGTRGRTHELVDPSTAPNDGSAAGNNIQARATFKGRLRARVYHAETGEWEDLGVIAETKDG